MDAIGVRIDFVKQKWPELIKMSNGGKLQMFRLGRTSVLRDGGGILEILYGRNIGAGLNDSRFNLPEYDRLFERARVLPPGRERDALYAQLGDLAAAYSPMILGTYRYRSVIAHRWVLGLKPDFFFREPWKFVDIDDAARRAAPQMRN
jgi:ABC-type transport system substrate-binding protein